MRAIVTVFLLTLSLPGFSQFSDSVFYHASFSATGNVNHANAGNTYLFNNSGKFNVNKKFVSVNAMASWVYGENSITKTNNDFLAVLDADLFQEIRKLYYWGLASYEKSFSLKLNNRFQVGAGLGYNVVKQPNTEIVVSDGLLYESTDLLSVDQYGRGDYETIRNSLRLKFHFLIRDLISIDGSEFLQNSLSDKRDYIIRTSTSVGMKLNKWLSLTVALNYNKLNITRSENLFLNYGLTMEKYF